MTQCAFTLIFGFSFIAAMLGMPSHGWLPPRIDFGFFIDHVHHFAVIAALSLAGILFTYKK